MPPVTVRVPIHVPILVLALLLPFAFMPGCLTPPAVVPAVNPVFDPADPAAAGYPPGTEMVELFVSPDIAIRGVFCPADEGAPVVLHLLEAGSTVTGGGYTVMSDGMVVGLNPGRRHSIWSLGDQGVASLLVDYEGVGISDGEPDPGHLRRDAEAAWNEAVARAGGPQRVVIRASSLGTLATAQLLADGKRPAGVVLIAPVFPDSVVGHFGREAYGTFLGTLGALFYGPIIDIDLTGTLESASVPLRVYTAPGDELLPDDEAARIHASVMAAGGQVIHEQQRGLMWNDLDFMEHIRLVVAGRSLLPGEVDALAAWLPDERSIDQRLDSVLSSLPVNVADRFGAGSEPRDRLRELVSHRLHDAPLQLAAVAMLGLGEADADQILWHAQSHPALYDELDFALRLERLSLADPAGPLPVHALTSAFECMHDIRGDGAHPADQNAALATVIEASRGIGVGPAVQKRFTMRRDKELAGRLRMNVYLLTDADLPPAERARITMRLLPRGAGLHERSETTESGERRVQVCIDGEWHTVDHGAMLEGDQVI